VFSLNINRATFYPSSIDIPE